MLQSPNYCFINYLYFFYKGEANNKQSKYKKQYISQIAGVVAHQEGFTEDTDPAEEDSQADGRVQGLQWLPRHRHSQER